jgi:hypothetical protein
VYDEFRDQVLKYSDLMKEEFADKRAKDEEEPEQPLSLFE